MPTTQYDPFYSLFFFLERTNTRILLDYTTETLHIFHKEKERRSVPFTLPVTSSQIKQLIMGSEGERPTRSHRRSIVTPKGVFPSITEACQATGYTYSKIRHMAVTKTHGYSFKE